MQVAQPPTLADRVLGVLRSRYPLASARMTGVSVALLGVWLSGVVYVTSKHEFWRDEVRAFSLARTADSPLDLFSVITYEGHPVLWYLLLYGGNLVADTSAVLPVVSILVAFAAVTVFLLLSPFPLWLRTLFLFSALPFYEYSVMARNYGISMLLLFVSAALYRHRSKHPFRLAVSLALLANTNAHSVILTLLFVAVWVWDSVAERKAVSIRRVSRSISLPLMVVAVGVLVSIAVILPKPNTIVTDARSLGVGDLVRALVSTGVRPADQFPALVPYIPGPADHLLLYVAALGLLPRLPLFLAALAAPLALGAVFELVYPGGYRHQGLLLVFLLSLYWIALETWNRRAAPRGARLLFSVGLYLALGVSVVKGVFDADRFARTDIRTVFSSSRAFGAFLTASEEYRDAIIVPEADYLIESLPYYAPNPIYLPREGRFAKTATFTTEAKAELSLRELLDTARRVATRTERPVLLVLGHWDLEGDETNRRRIAYGRYFTWSEEELAELRRSAELLLELDSARDDENYRVFVVQTGDNFYSAVPGQAPTPRPPSAIRELK